MSTSITTRQTAGTGATVKGSPLSNTEVDNNFIGLNQAVQPAGGTAGQILAKIDATNFNSQWVDNYAVQVKLPVKNATGATIPKGAVVYVSGATGANALISLAQASGDSTSATTVGFLESTLATGDTGLVVVTGVISGIDTSAATEGDPVWLSGTTAGGVLFGVANKPQAPTHIVYLGTVTRAHATVGEIQVHISNGWEIEELHDVKITSKANNDTLFYNSAQGVWVNAAPAAARSNLGLGALAVESSLKTVNGNSLLGSGNIQIDGGVTSFNTRTGAVTLSSGDVTTALGFTPYNSSNPNGYITSSALSSYLPLTGGTLSGSVLTETGPSTWGVYSKTSGYNNWSGIWFSGHNAELMLRRDDGQIATRISANGAYAIINNNQILHAGNYWNYALPSNANFTSWTSNDANGYYRVSAGNSSAQLGLFRSGSNVGGAYLGADDTYFRVYSSSFGERLRIPLAGGALVANGNTVLDAGNYTSYAATASHTHENIQYFDAPGSPGTYVWVRASMGGFNAGGETVRFSVQRSINDNGNSPYGGPSADFTVHAREWHGGQECATCYYSEHGAGSGAGGLYISHAGPRDLNGGGYWFYMRLEGGIRYLIRKFNNTGSISSFEATAVSDPGGVTAMNFGFNLLGNSADFWASGGNKVLHAGNYTSYRGTQLVSPNGASVVAADSAMPDSGHSFIHTLGLGPSGNDGHILGMTWASTTSSYGAQIWVDTDPNNRMAFRSRSGTGVWTGWNELIHSSNYSSYALPLSGGNMTGGITDNSASGGGLRVISPGQGGNGGNWGSNATGCFKIRLPQGYSSTMLRMTVRVYTYDGSSFDIYCGGYNYGGSYWVNTFAYMDTQRRGSLNVRFGFDGSYCCIYIGETNTVWQYPQVFVTDAQFGYSSYSSSQWANGWAVTLETSQQNVSATETAYAPLHAGNYTNYPIARTDTAAWQGGVGTRLFRRDGSDNYSVQTHWTGSYWRLYGYLNDSGHADTQVGLADRSSRANGNFYIDDNYGCGVVGAYSSYRYQGVFAMGDSYKLPASGETTGSLYGIAWAHPNAGGVAGNLDSHGMIVMINGAFASCMSNSIKASGNVTAYSDERLKTNWRPMPDSYVARLAQVKVGVYDRLDCDQITQVGVSAQSFQKLLPEAITTANDDMGTLSVSYGNAALASAVELAKDNVELRARIERLESLIETLIGDQK